MSDRFVVVLWWFIQLYRLSRFLARVHGWITVVQEVLADLKRVIGDLLLAQWKPHWRLFDGRGIEGDVGRQDWPCKVYIFWKPWQRLFWFWCVCVISWHYHWQKIYFHFHPKCWEINSLSLLQKQCFVGVTIYFVAPLSEYQCSAVTLLPVVERWSTKKCNNLQVSKFR